MLGTGDRFSFANGKCSFLTRGGLPIVMDGKYSWSKPQAIITIAFADVFARKLGPPLSCAVEAVRTPDGFEFVFRSTPNVGTETGLTKIDLIVIVADFDPGAFGGQAPDLRTLIDEQGCQGLTWMLRALLQKEYTHRLAAHEISWTRPAASHFIDQKQPDKIPNPLLKLLRKLS